MIIPTIRRARSVLTQTSHATKRTRTHLLRFFFGFSCTPSSLADWLTGWLAVAGVLLYSTGVRYEGSFSHGKRHGPGRMLYPLQQSITKEVGKTSS